MDATDFRLLLALLREPFAPYVSLGAKVGMTGTAAKARIDSLARRGTLRGIFTVIAPATFGRIERQVIFTGVPADADLRKVLAVRDVVWAGRGHEGPVAVNLALRAPGDVPLDELRAVLGPSVIATVAPDAQPPPRIVLSPLDWRVLDALLDEPRASVRKLAARTGLSERVTKERRDALVRRGAAWVAPDLDATREAGLILFSAYVSFRERDDAKRLALPSLARIRTHDEPPGAFYWGAAATFAEAQSIEAMLRAAPGVVAVSLTVPREVVVANERQHAWIAEELAAWEKARRKS